MGAVAVAVLLLPIDAIAFAIGYSIFIVSIVDRDDLLGDASPRRSTRTTRTTDG